MLKNKPTSNKKGGDIMKKWDYKTDIDYDAIDATKVKENHFLFYLLTIASYIEITSEIYAKNLSEYYSDNPEALQWLNNTWEQEEVQHGKALKSYVAHVWPDYSWEKGYARFLELYLPLCEVSAFQPTKASEMIARMIVETGTSTAYRSFEDYANSLGEPVLAGLCHQIYKDEVNHYSYFNRYFSYYNKDEKLGRKDIFKVIASRLKDVSNEDVELAFQSIYETDNKTPFEAYHYDKFKENLNQLAKNHYPYSMAIKMTMKPLALNKTIEATTVPMIRGAMKVIGI